MRQNSVGRRPALAAVCGGVWITFYATWLALRPGGDRALTIFADTAYLVPLAAAALLSLLASRRVPADSRPFWGLMALACISWLAADTLWCVRDLAAGSAPTRTGATSGSSSRTRSCSSPSARRSSRACA